MRNSTAITILALVVLAADNCVPAEQTAWTLSALPSSVRLDPVTGRIIEDRTDIYDTQPPGHLLQSNPLHTIPAL